MAGSSATKAVLSELAKRVPKNQLNQFYNFLDLQAKYKSRINKYPEKLPRIDWDNYRTNVRIEAIKMVDEFEKKYEELNKVFDDRTKLDTKKYYDELEKQRAEVQAHVKQYIAESNKRIKAYEVEIARLCNMKPYSDMTMEEYIDLRPEHADCIPHRRKPLFWPHDPDEQVPGPVGITRPDVGGGGGSYPVKPSDFKGKTEKFEFNAGEMQETKKPFEAKAAKVIPEPATEPAPTNKLMEAEPAPPKHVEKKKAKMKSSNPSTALVDEPKIHIDEPISEEVKRQLDPCNLIERLKKKLEAAELLKAQTATDKVTICTSSKPKEKEQPAEKAEVKPMEKKVEQDKNPDPSNLEQQQQKKKEPDAEKVDKFNKKAEEQVPKEKKSATKPAAKEPIAKPKKPHPCELSKKKVQANRDVCKTAATKGPYKDEKKDSCIFTDPCKSGFGTGTKAAQTKSTGSKKAEGKPEPKANKKSQPSDEGKKEKADVSSKENGNKKVDSCARTPYYNPFRSEEENKNTEEEACDECQEEDPCVSNDRKEKPDYYNPFKDDKKKK